METPHPWSDAWLDRARLRTDPEADELVAQVVQQSGRPAALRLFELLTQRIELPLEELPPPIQDFVKGQQLPEWADPAKIALAEQVFLDHGPKFLVFLYYRSLPTLYACANGARVLHQTGRLSLETQDPKRFARRIAETGQFLLDVMAPGHLIAGGLAIERATKVRLIHASIRHFIPAEHWQTETWGKPINQEDLAITLLTFSISMIEALELIHLSLSQTEAEAYLHHWKVIGWLMGIESTLLPADVSEGRALLRTIRLRQHASSEAGNVLSEALIGYAREMLPGRIFDQAPCLLLRFFSGKELADLLGVQHRRSIWHWLLPVVVRRWFGLFERLEEHGLPPEVLTDRISTWMMRKLVESFVPGKERLYEVTPALKQAWNLR